VPSGVSRTSAMFRVLTCGDDWHPVFAGRRIGGLRPPGHAIDGLDCLCGTDRNELKRQLFLHFQQDRLAPAYVLTTFGGMKRSKRRVETVRVGNAAVKIHRRTRTVDGNRYLTFEVCDYTGGRRSLRSFADHQAACQRSSEECPKLAA